LSTLTEVTWRGRPWPRLMSRATALSCTGRPRYGLASSCSRLRWSSCMGWRRKVREKPQRRGSGTARPGTRRAGWRRSSRSAAERSPRARSSARLGVLANAYRVAVARVRVVPRGSVSPREAEVGVGCGQVVGGQRVSAPVAGVLRAGRPDTPQLGPNLHRLRCPGRRLPQGKRQARVSARRALPE
jgi:hypothetical protein